MVSIIAKKARIVVLKKAGLFIPLRRLETNMHQISHSGYDDFIKHSNK